ncbi:MAG: sugar transferase, partial [Senegalia sp. (in: firmicutes)]
MKKLFDFTSSLFAVFIFSPILIVTSIAIKLESKGPIVFKQKRPGINNEIFNIYKFRSMKVETPDVA